MIGDDFCQIGWVCPLRNDRAGVRDVLKQGAIGEERAARHEDDAGVRAAVAGEIRCRDGASVIKHDIEDQNFGFLLAQKLHGVVLAGDHMDAVVLTFKMACPDTGQLFIRCDDQYQNGTLWLDTSLHAPHMFQTALNSLTER